MEDKKPFPMFTGPSYQGRSKRFDSQRAVNMYCEIDEAGGAGQSTPGKDQQTMVCIGTPGLNLLQTIGSGPIRAVYTLSNLQLTMVVSGNQVFQLSGANAIPIPLAGNLLTSTGEVKVADNGVQVLFVDGQYGYYQTIGATTGSISTIGTPTGGSGYAPSTGSNYYTDVVLTGGSGTGATADITVTNGSVSGVIIINPGVNYLATDVLSAAPGFDDVGAGSGFLIAVSAIATGPFLTQITDPNFYPSQTITFQDGYFILNQTGTTNFFISDLYSIDFLPLNQEAKTGNSDILMGLISVNRQLYLLGASSIEMWWDSGASGSSPFARQDGRFSQYGLAAPYSLAILQENFYWISSNKQGGGIVMGLTSGMPTRISTHAVEYSIQNAGLLSECTAYAYQQEGHYFYAVNVPGTNTTWVYDIATSLWHERQSSINGTLGRHLGQNHAVLNDIHIVGDYNSGNIYQYDLNYYYDNGEPLFRIRQCPHVALNNNNIFFNLMDVDFQFGVGLINQPQPYCVLQVSKDGGMTFGNPIKGRLGPLGAYRTRCRFDRCGYGRDLVFKLTVSDAVEFQMLGAYCDIEIGDQ